MSFAIVEAGQAHIEIVATFVHGLLDELTNGAGPDLETVVANAQETLRLDQVTAFVAMDGTTPVGAIILNECAAIYAGGKFGEISELFILPKFRSKGVAARLIETAIAAGKGRGWQRLEVGAPQQPAWDRTLAFYLREGFEEVGPRLRRLI